MKIPTTLAPFTPHAAPVDTDLMSGVNTFFLHGEAGLLDKLFMLAMLYNLSSTLDRLCEPFVGKRGTRSFEFSGEVYLSPDIPDQTFEFRTPRGHFTVEIFTPEEEYFSPEKVVDSEPTFNEKYP